jgi:hypothetical protein
MSVVYRIKDWDTHFENNKSREREKCSFCCIPNKQDGLGYGMLMREENGEALYGAFVAVVLVCSKQKARSGWITADGLPTGCPLSARQLSVKCQFKEATIQKMLEVISTNEIGWIEAIRVEQKECPSSARQVPAHCPSGALEGKEGKGKKEGKEGPPALKISEQIKFERELTRVTNEIRQLGQLSDYDRGTPKHNRLCDLLKRQRELCKTLGVVA